MNGFHFKQISARLVRLPWVANSIGLVVIGLVVTGVIELVSLAWRGASLPRTDLKATLTDSRSWDRVPPGWPKYMPELPAGNQVATSQSPSAAAPSIAGGPELFAPDMQPLAAATPPPQAFVQNAPPQILRPQPLCTQPAPAFAQAPARQPGRQYVRSEAMERISIQSDQQVRHGFELASRGAYFAARAEFTAALRLIAQGLDNDQNTTLHSQALSAALIAMKEAQDFIPPGGKLEGELHLPPIVAAHSTPVLKNVPAEQLQAMRALKEYHNFAQAELVLAAGHEVSGSMALGALGKMYSALASRPIPEIVAPAAKAIVFFQAAMLVCPKNYMAANDLGVLLAHNGDYLGARRLLEHSVLIYRCPENLSNLSVVYRQVGEPRLAELAGEKAQVAQTVEIARQKNASLAAGGQVQWVDPAALAQQSSPWNDPPARPATAAGEQGPAASSAVVGQAPPPFGFTAH